MTTPVKDISCHGTLLLSSLPAPFLQSFSAFFTDHCLSLNLFSHPYAHPLHLFPPTLFFVLPQLIISESLLINRINVFSDAPCPCSPLLLNIFWIVHEGSFLVFGCGQSESGSCIIFTLCEEKEKPSEA